MSRTPDGFLGKVSKGIKKTLYDDEPDSTSGSLIIERLQSLSGAASPEQGKKTSETQPEAGAGGRTQNRHPASSVAVSAAFEPARETTGPDGLRLEPSCGEGTLIDENPDAARSPGPMATILVVEDEIVTQRLMRNILEERGYEVVLAEDGVDALMALGKIRFDLILCDINMPNLDGFKLVEFLNAKNIVIPVVFITSREDVEDEIRGLALGARDYVRKPINRDLLLLRIRKALDK